MIVIDQHQSKVQFDGQDAGGSDPSLPPPASRNHRKNQRGAIGMMFALMAVPLLGFIGLAMSISMVYNRKAELQAVADNAAVAAANQLVGTQAGVQAARDAAAAEAAKAKYHYQLLSVTWTDDAIKFSSSATAPEGSWLDFGSAKTAPSGLIFAKVDTRALDANIGMVSTVLMGVLPNAQATTMTSASAVAGRASINITPLAICALSPLPANPRSNLTAPANVELEEYGFRRGVGYDLMKLNSNATQPAENFVIDPIAPLGSIGSSANISAAVVGPFVCMGRMPRPRVTGSALPLSRPFPLSSLFNRLNSRFDQYVDVDGHCIPSQARPDANIKEYVYSTSAAWMKTPPAQSRQTAAPYSISGTIASQTTAASSTDYGPLWAFAKAVPYSSYVPGTPEPSTGYTTFPTTDAAWATLYPPGPKPNSYPATTPYNPSGGGTFQAPSPANGPGVRFRRVLNVPLLSCPVAGGSYVSATVLAIGKFFMTVPATSTSIHAEFAGVVPEQSLGGPVELFQ